MIFPRTTIIIGMVVALAVSACGQVPAQVSSGTATGTQPYHVYGGLRENLDLASGQLSLTLPLLSLPGRAGHDLNVELQYLRRLSWSYIQNDGSCTNCPLFTYSSGLHDPFPSLYGGWRFSIPLLQMSRIVTDTLPADWQHGAMEVYCTTQYTLTTADGTNHRFFNKAGCMAGGDRHTEYETTVSDSNDASFSRLDTSNMNDVIAYLPDGTQIHFADAVILNDPTSQRDVKVVPVSIVDRNGNSIRIAKSVQFDTNTSVKTTEYQIQDTLDRLVRVAIAEPPIVPGGFTVTSTISYVDHAKPEDTRYITTRADNAGFTVTFPNGNTYTVSYDANGFVSKIAYPTGGYTRYEWTPKQQLWHFQCATDSRVHTAVDVPQVTAVAVCPYTHACSSEEEQKTIYAPDVDGTIPNNRATTITTPDNSWSILTFATDPFFSGRELTREVHHSDGSVARMVATEYTDGQRPWSMPWKITTTNDKGQVSRVELQYDTYSLVNPFRCAQDPSSWTQSFHATEKQEYGFDSKTTPIRRTHTNWVTSASYDQRHIWTLKQDETVYEGWSTTPAANTTYEYDNYNEPDMWGTTGVVSAATDIGHDLAYSPQFKIRGNLTAVSRWRNTDGATVTTRNWYDDAGNLTWVRDPLGHYTRFDYSDSWADTSCMLASGRRAAFATETDRYLGSKAQATKQKYYFCSGKVASAEDANGQTTTFSYDDLFRLKLKTNPAGGGYISYSYQESTLPFTVTTSTAITDSIERVHMEQLDGLGRVGKTVDSDPDGDVAVDTVYDGLDRVVSRSNPYRSSETVFTTKFTYDGLGRTETVEHPDGGKTSTRYDGACTRVSDPAGKKRWTCTDALGRIVEVTEPVVNP